MGGHLKESGGAEDPGLVNGENDGKAFAGLQSAQKGI